jgi:hypothetical protein
MWRSARMRPKDGQLRCLVDYPWKLILRPRDPSTSELYDLASDPEELRNLFAEDHPEARRLTRELTKMGVVNDELAPGTEDPEVVERLRSLGYGN